MVGAPTWTLAVAASFSLTELEAADPGAKSLTAAPITAVHVGSLRVGRRSKSEGPQRNAAQGCVCAVCMRCAMRRTSSGREPDDHFVLLHLAGWKRRRPRRRRCCHQGRTIWGVVSTAADNEDRGDRGDDEEAEAAEDDATTPRTSNLLGAG